MAKPSTKVYREPSPRQLSTWSPSRVKAALQLLMQGDFAQAGALVDELLADDRVQATLGTRINGVLSLPLVFQPVDDTDRAQAAATALEQDWWVMATEAMLSQWMTYGLLLGASLAELVWDTSRERSLPRLEVWHPSNVRHKDDEWQIRQGTDAWLTITPGDGKWALFTPFGVKRSGTRALIRALAVPWLSKQYAVTDWNHYSELHGSGTRVGKAPVGATDQERQDFRNDLANIASDAAVVLPGGWELELLEAKVGSGEVFDKLIGWADKAIAVAILGQNLTTDVEGGSLAAAAVHENVRYDLVQADVEVLSTTAHNDVLPWWAEFNFGDRALAPWPKWDAEPPTDEAATATAFNARAQALLTLSTAAAQTGLPVDWVNLAGQLRIPLIDGEDMRPPVPPAPSMASIRLASGDSVDSARGFARGQLYSDRLTDVARDRAAAATRPALDRVLDLVNRATGYEQLRESLLSEFGNLDVDDLADLTESSLVLASLAGRLGVIDDA